MSFQIERQSPAFAAVVRGINLARPLTESDRSKLQSLVKDYAVVILKDQHDVGKDELFAFASLYGQASRCDDITNLDADGNIRSLSDVVTQQTKANEIWHVDMLAFEKPPVACFLLAKELPDVAAGQGETQFVDLSQIWERLSGRQRHHLIGKQGYHSYQALARRAGPDYPLDLVEQYKPVAHPLVTIDPLSNEKIVLIGKHTDRILESEIDVDELMTIALTPDNIYSHQWSTGDLLFWNNRRVMHRVTPYDAVNQRRRLLRVEALGERPKAYETSFVEKMLSFC